MPKQKNQFPSIKDIPKSKWESLSQKKIFFGHHSVGLNIIDGIKDVMRENPKIDLEIVETDNPTDFDAPIFSHSRVGQNLEPKSKTHSFVALMNEGFGNMVDIAFFKFCYVDIKKGIDIKELFEDYRREMSQLRKEFPEIIFVHLSVPLKVTQTSWKTWLKDLTGKGDLYEYSDNIERNRYNNMLRKEYQEKEPFFDLARIESTYPDGARAFFKSKGITYYKLVSEYTDDGGHLNEMGRRFVAEQLLIYLAGLD